MKTTPENYLNSKQSYKHVVDQKIAKIDENSERTQQLS